MMARQTEARLLPGGDGLLPWEGNAASGDFRQAAVCCRKLGIMYNIIKYIRIVYLGRNGHEEVYQGAGAGVDHAGGE